jgi:hypothetical protein
MRLPDSEPESSFWQKTQENERFHSWAGYYEHQGNAICTGSLGKIFIYFFIIFFLKMLSGLI